MRERTSGPRTRSDDRIFGISGPIDFTSPWRTIPSDMLKPVAHAPIENALRVMRSPAPNAYRAKKAMLRWATDRSLAPRIQLYGVPGEPLDSSHVTPLNTIRPSTQRSAIE